jgi:hypothetical protein
MIAIHLISDDTPGYCVLSSQFSLIKEKILRAHIEQENNVKL